MTFQKILAPTDFSAAAEAAARVAADLSQRYNAELTLLHVHEPVAYALSEGYTMNMPSQLDRSFEELNQKLDTVQRLARALGVTRIDTRLLQGPVVQEITAFAASFDLIVMGTHGRTGLAHLFMGSVAERVLQRAPGPVLVVRWPKTLPRAATKQADGPRYGQLQASTRGTGHAR